MIVTTMCLGVADGVLPNLFNLGLEVHSGGDAREARHVGEDCSRGRGGGGGGGGVCRGHKTREVAAGPAQRTW